MKQKLPAWLTLTLICVVAAALLSVTNLATRDTIAENALKEANATLIALLPETRSSEERNDVTIAMDGDGNVVGYVAKALTQGFGGEIEITVALLPDGTLAGISVGGTNFAETAGLGAKAKEPEFQEQFIGKTLAVSLTKDGGEIEAISGATITSTAVVQGVNAAAAAIAQEIGIVIEGFSD